jgi:integrase
MQDRGLSTRTVQYTHAVLRRGLKQAKRWGMVDRNVAEDVDPPRLKRDEIQPLDREQTRTLLQAAEGDRLHALYVVAITAGSRRAPQRGGRELWERDAPPPSRRHCRVH